MIVAGQAMLFIQRTLMPLMQTNSAHYTSQIALIIHHIIECLHLQEDNINISTWHEARGIYVMCR